MTKKLLLPTLPERRQARQKLAERCPSTSSLREVALAQSNFSATLAPSKPVSEHNSSCERSENQDRLRKWIEDQQGLDVAWKPQVREDDRKPPPIPPRPKALLERLHRQQPAAMHTTQRTRDIVTYPTLPPSPPLSHHADGVTTLPAQPTSCDITPSEVLATTTSNEGATFKHHVQPASEAERSLIRPPQPPPPARRSPPLVEAANASRPPPELAPACPPIPQVSTTLPPATSTLPQPSTLPSLPFTACAPPIMSASPTISVPEYSSIPDISTLRTFTDTSGDFKVQARLLEFSNGLVSLRKVNGVAIAVPLSRLSGEDIWWVFEEMERRRRPDGLSLRLAGEREVGSGVEFQGVGGHGDLQQRFVDWEETPLLQEKTGQEEEADGDDWNGLHAIKKSIGEGIELQRLHVHDPENL